MFRYIKGIITEINANSITIECQSIGYLINVPNPFDYQIGEELVLHVHQKIKEDAHELYGFRTVDERDMFIKLTSVKGLGPKGAMAILASANVSEIVRNIEESNSTFFIHFPGIGAKSSAQIILDLKGKLHFNVDTKANNKNEKLGLIQDALKSLGYNNAEIKNATKDLVIDDSLNMSDLIKTVLRKFNRS